MSQHGSAYGPCKAVASLCIKGYLDFALCFGFAAAPSCSPWFRILDSPSTFGLKLKSAFEFGHLVWNSLCWTMDFPMSYASDREHHSFVQSTARSTQQAQA